jgi:hypothetical protein
MAKTKSKIAQAKPSEQREGNRYTRAARVLAKDDTIDGIVNLADPERLFPAPLGLSGAA